MPYGIKRVAGGYKVESKNTGKTHSNKPISKSMAARQMRALYANTKDENGRQK
jgi:hypothetical protein